MCATLTKLYNVKRHNTIPKEDTPYTWETCGKSYTIIQEISHNHLKLVVTVLLKHKRIHIRDKPYTMELYLMSNKIKHKLIPTGDKP